MTPDEGPTVFTRLRGALADAQQEEAEFAAEVTADDPDSAIMYRDFSQWAEETFGSAKSLYITPKAAQLLRADLARAVDDGATVRNVAELPFVKPLIELHLARFGVDRLETGAGRLFKVLDCLIEADLQPIARAYLTSVAQLYIFGFNPECVVLARSALEASLESALTRARGGTSSPDDHKLYDLIVAASGMRLLDDAGVREAHEIRLAGRDAVHVSLGSQKLKALDAIRSLHRILKQLFPTDPAPAS